MGFGRHTNSIRDAGTQTVMVSTMAVRIATQMVVSMQEKQTLGGPIRTEIRSQTLWRSKSVPIRVYRTLMEMD